MEKLFYPDSIAIWGLSRKKRNIPRLILENLLRWGYKGRIFGVNPSIKDSHVDGVKMFKKANDLPVVPDLAVTLIPARFIPETIEACGEFGIRRIAIPSGGFNESGEEGEQLAINIKNIANKYGIRFVGPNGLTVANTSNGMCVLFVPLYRPKKGGMSIISQSGGLGLMFWNLMANENVGLAKFASIGNKLDLDEVDFLKYFGNDPETKVICMYLENITKGREFVEAASKIDKPIIVYKSNTTDAGKKAAMSHIAALSNNDEIIDSAFERSGIIRAYNFEDLINIAKAFELPPMKGNKIMAMSPAGGFTVIMGDICEKVGFEFAEPGKNFYKGISGFGSAGVISHSNPLDMGDMYNPNDVADVFHSVLHNDNIDGAVYVDQWPLMPRGEDVFSKLFNKDISQETTGAIRSSGKPLAVCLFGLAKTISVIKNRLSIPLFNTPEEMIKALKVQQEYYAKEKEFPFISEPLDNMDIDSAKKWLISRNNIVGEEILELMEIFGIPVARSIVVSNDNDAVDAASNIGYPVVMKVISPDAIHKTEAGGIILNINNEDDVRKAYTEIRANLLDYKEDAEFNGVRVMEMAGEGYDMFVGGEVDDTFGPAVFFGYGGIYVEVFKDVANALCPSNYNEIYKKIKSLKSYDLIKGARGKRAGDIELFIDIILRVSHFIAMFPEIKELDLNPVRILADGSGVIALDARARIMAS
jgi:acetate---CoA ligase (ADP-forming)